MTALVLGIYTTGKVYVVSQVKAMKELWNLVLPVYLEQQATLFWMEGVLSFFTCVVQLTQLVLRKIP